MFTRWANTLGTPPNQVTPIQEEFAYKYDCMLHSEFLPATRTSRFREAIALALHILGMDDKAVALNSKRITGSAHRSFGRKRFASERSYALRVGRVMMSITLKVLRALSRIVSYLASTLALVCEESTLNLHSI